MQILKHGGALFGALGRWLWEVRGAIRKGPTARDRRMILKMQRESIRRELATRPAPPEYPVNRIGPLATKPYEAAQEQAYWRLWRLLRPVDAAPIPPQVLDPSVNEHVEFALNIVADFDAVREEPGASPGSLHRPVSSLPYSPRVIRKCCEFLIRIADDPATADDANREVLIRERDALGNALFSLDYFVDSAVSEVPRRPFEKEAHRNAAASARPVKPVAGDHITRTGSPLPDEVDEVIGVSANDEWMVITKSGASVQIIRSADSGHWKEVEAIIPAAASWLALTPPAGSPTFGEG